MNNISRPTIDRRRTPAYLDTPTIRESIRTTNDKLTAYEKAKAGQPTELVDKITRMYAILDCYKLKPRKRDKALQKFKPLTKEELATINRIQNLPSGKMAAKATAEQKKLMEDVSKLYAELGLVLKGSSHKEIMKRLREKIAPKLKEKEQGWISWIYEGVKTGVKKIAGAMKWTLGTAFKTITFPLRHPILTALIAGGGAFGYMKYAPVRKIMNTAATWITTKGKFALPYIKKAGKVALPYLKKTGKYLATGTKKIVDYGSKAITIIKAWWKSF